MSDPRPLSVIVAEPVHYQAVANLMYEVFAGERYGEMPAPMSAVEVAERWAAHGRIYVALAPDEGVLGTGTLVVPPSRLAQLAGEEDAEVRLVAVSRSARRRGIARAIMTVAMEDAAKQNKTNVVLCTQSTMTAAQRMYDQLGFTRWPERDVGRTAARSSRTTSCCPGSASLVNGRFLKRCFSATRSVVRNVRALFLPTDRQAMTNYVDADGRTTGTPGVPERVAFTKSPRITRRSLRQRFGNTNSAVPVACNDYRAISIRAVNTCTEAFQGRDRRWRRMAEHIVQADRNHRISGMHRCDERLTRTICRPMVPDLENVRMQVDSLI